MFHRLIACSRRVLTSHGGGRRNRSINASTKLPVEETTTAQSCYVLGHKEITKIHEGSIFKVQVPRDVEPGCSFVVSLGPQIPLSLQAQCPSGVRPGQYFDFRIAEGALRGSVYARIPDGVRPRDHFLITVQDGETLMAQCPAIQNAGQGMWIRIDPQPLQMFSFDR